MIGSVCPKCLAEFPDQHALQWHLKNDHDKRPIRIADEERLVQIVQESREYPNEPVANLLRPDETKPEPDYRDLTRRLAEALRMVEEIPQPKDWTIDRWSAFKARRRIALAEARAAGVIE